jgi:phosphatidylglycerol lysyltransferase
MVDTASAIRPLRIQRRRVRWFFAGLLAAIGGIDVVEAFVVHHSLRDRVLEALLPTGVTEGSRTAVVVSGLALLLLARGMAHGKRVAWTLTCLVLGLSALLHLVKDLDVEQAVLAGWVLLGLWWLRADFQAGSDPAALRRGLAALTLSAALAVLEAAAGSVLLSNQLTPRVGLLRTLEQLVFSWAGGAAYEPRTERAAWFLDSMPWVSGSLLLIGLLELLRPVALRAPATEEERARARKVLRRWGHNPICWLGLAPENSFLWSGDASSFVAYRRSGRVAMALGDPVGPPTELGVAVSAFIAFCERRDWTPAFYQAEAEPAYRQRGYTVLPVGSDAVVDAAAFKLDGSERGRLRYSVRRCEREGVTFTFQRGDEAWEAAAADLREVSAAWLRDKGPELRFSLGRLETMADRAVIVALARTRAGRLVAFASWLPVARRKGWTLDLMRRRPEAPYGVMDALIAESILEAARRGIKEVSLGLVLDLERSGLRPPSGLAGVYGWLRSLDRSSSLRSFKEKFGPRWEPRYLVVPDAAALPTVLTALARVHLPALAPAVRLWSWVRRWILAPKPAPATDVRATAHPD